VQLVIHAEKSNLMAWFDFELKEGHHGQAHWAVAVVVATLCAFVATAVVGS